MATPRKPMPRIDVDMLYYALITQDVIGSATTYAIPKALMGVNNIGYDPATQSATYDADGGAYATYSSDGDVKATVKVADLLSEDYAVLMGVYQDPNSGIIEEGVGDNPPELALGFRSQKSDGSYRFVWIMKGKFAKGSEAYATKGSGGVTFNDTEIVLTSLNLSSNGKKRRFVDSNDPKLPENVTLDTLSNPETGWFSSPVYVPEAE